MVNKRLETDKHKLVPGQEVAIVVKRIFQLYKTHKNARHIADPFNREGINIPQNYYYDSVGQENLYKNNTRTWCSATIFSILKNEVYLGRTVQSKRAVKSFKTKQVPPLSPEIWIMVEDTYEALVSTEEWGACNFCSGQTDAA